MQMQTRGGTAVELNEAVFGVDFKPALIHQVVVSYQATGRAGTKAQKSRSAVSGGGAKPFRQKGTGRARAGTIRSPLWRSGGVTFAASPRDHSQKINKKMYRGAMRSIVSELIRQERLILVDNFGVETPKTKDMAARLRDMETGKALILAADNDDNLLLAARNLKNVRVHTAGAVDPVSLVGADKVIATVDALRKLEERLQ